jgi:hypothetical protein
LAEKSNHLHDVTTPNETKKNRKSPGGKSSKNRQVLERAKFKKSRDGGNIMRTNFGFSSRSRGPQKGQKFKRLSGQVRSRRPICLQKFRLFNVAPEYLREAVLDPENSGNAGDEAAPAVAFQSASGDAPPGAIKKQWSGAEIFFLRTPGAPRGQKSAKSARALKTFSFSINFRHYAFSGVEQISSLKTCKNLF